MTRLETCDSPRQDSTERPPLTQATQEAYSRDAQCLLTKDRRSGCNDNNDRDLDNFFNRELTKDIYQKDCILPQPPQPDNGKGYKEFQRGQNQLDKSEKDLQDALRRLENGNVRGARQELLEAYRESGRSIKHLEKGLRKHDGGGANGGYGEDEISDGVKELRGGRSEIKNALDLIKKGKFNEAKEAVREALKSFNSGEKEIDNGVDVLKGKAPGVMNPRNREQAGQREFERGDKHFDRAEQDLRDALQSLDGNDRGSAMRDLNRGKRNIEDGTNDTRDGLRLNQWDLRAENKIRNGLDEISSTQCSIDTAMDLLQRGCEREARQMIQDALNRLDKGHDKVDKGVDGTKERPWPRPFPLPRPEPQPEPCPSPEQPPEPCPTKPEPPEPYCPEPPMVRIPDNERPGYPGDRPLPIDRIRPCPPDGDKPNLKPGEFFCPLLLTMPKDIFKHFKPGNPMDFTPPKPGDDKFHIPIFPPFPGAPIDLQFPNPGNFMDKLPRPPFPHEIIGSIADPGNLLDKVPGPHNLIKDGIKSIAKKIKKLF